MRAIGLDHWTRRLTVKDRKPKLMQPQRNWPVNRQPMPNRGYPHAYVAVKGKAVHIDGVWRLLAADVTAKAKSIMGYDGKNELKRDDGPGECLPPNPPPETCTTSQGG